MSTVKNNTSLARFAQIAALGEEIFHVDDLANLWGIENANTLHTTLKRYVNRRLLFRVYRGFYAIKPIEKLDPYLLGIKALHNYAYVSTETVLVNAGVMQQALSQITLISSKSMHFSIGNNNYYSRQLTDRYLYQEIGIEQKGKIKIASIERAVADLLYFNPKAYFDAKKLINWSKVKMIQKTIGYSI